MKKNPIPKSKLKVARMYDKLANRITRLAGRPVALLSAFLIIVLWGATGPLFNYSDSWQLVINTGTTIITFLMVFIIQQSQNKDTAAIQLKLNELIACNEKASNRLIDIEDLTEDELMVLKNFYVKLSKLAQKEDDLHSSHSLDEAHDYHQNKQAARTKKVRTIARKNTGE
jgi:low affinity Fe/Cu permease